MNSLAFTEPDTVGLIDVARRLAGCEVRQLVPIPGGRNNGMFRVDTVAGPVALKFYLRQPDDPRDRQGNEVRALRFLRRYHVSSVPEVLADDRGAGCALFEWIDGEAVTWPTNGEVDAALRLAAELRALADADDADRLSAASAATFSGMAVARQVESRLARIRTATGDDPDLANFVEKSFAPTMRRIIAEAADRMKNVGCSFEAEVPRECRTLSPSDFGFHNALRRGDGRIAFLDFEYFGWDDPVKLVSDFLWHPGMRLSQGLKRYFLDRSLSVFGDRDAGFVQRLQILYPLYGLCWCLILLNEFLPSSWQRRAISGGAAEHQEVKKRQLIRARRLISTVVECHDTGPKFH
jgi:hypothetical protein